LLGEEISSYPTLFMETILTGTFSQVKALIDEEPKDAKISKTCELRNNMINTKIISPTKPKVFLFKSRGRPQETVKEQLSGKLEFKVKWKEDMLRCVDSSPLFFQTNTFKKIVSGSHSGKVCCLALDSGQKVWSVNLPDRVESSPVFSKNLNHIVIGCYDFNLYCLNADSGSQVWTFKSGGLIKCSALILPDDSVLVGSYDQKIYRVRGLSGRCIWKRDLPGSVLASPVLMVDNIVCVATLSGFVTALDYEDGCSVWEIKLSHPVFGSPLFTGAAVVVPSVNNSLYSLAPHDGSIIWTLRSDGPIFSSPILVNDKILFGCHDAKVYCVEAPGNLNWCVELGGMVAGAVDCNTRGIVGCCTTDGTLYALKLEDGTILKSFKLGGEIFSSPLMVEDKVVVGSRDNFLYSTEIEYSNA